MLFMPGKSQVIWIVSFTFHGLKKYFLNTVLLKRPVMLVQDGHKSHMTVDLIDLAHANNVILFNLSPHTTHATQPLDKNIFKPLKSAFATVLLLLVRTIHCLRQISFIFLQSLMTKLVLCSGSNNHLMMLVYAHSIQTRSKWIC